LSEQPLLQVDRLHVYYSVMRGTVRACENVSFKVSKGEALGLAGESGCGKTTVAYSILRLLPPNATVKGKVIFKGRDIYELPEDVLRKEVRWKGISIVFQGAMNALNPVLKIGDQIVEAILAHEETSPEEARERACRLFELVGIDPDRIDNYPHEFSGGMKQRAMIAMALACNPDLLIADEPTTGLDIIVQAQILELLRNLKERLQISYIVISHDLSVISEICDTVAIMYAGKIVEYGPAIAVYKRSVHPYTRGLLSAFPSIKAPKGERLRYIPGAPPNLLNPPPGCRFWPRCKLATDKCRREEPPLVEVEPNHWIACHLAI